MLTALRLAPKYQVQATIAQPLARLRTSVQALQQEAVISSQRLTVQALSINAQHPAKQPFPYLLGQLQMGRASIYTGRLHFSPSGFLPARSCPETSTRPIQLDVLHS